MNATLFKDVVTGETVTLELHGMTKMLGSAILTATPRAGDPYVVKGLGHRGFTHLDAVKSGRFEIVTYGERAESSSSYI